MKIHTRPEKDGDAEFLIALYASTREAELGMTGWPQVMKTQFLNNQFEAQRRGYRNAFPQAAFSIVLADGMRAGRIVVNRNEGEIRLVDIALLPEFQGKGIGTQLVMRLCEEALNKQKQLRLAVLQGSRALALYRRMGFVETEDDGVRFRMEWRPVSTQPTG